MAMTEELCNNGKEKGEFRKGKGEFRNFPGFRFCPTEEELVDFYLKKRAQAGHPLNFDRVIPTLDLYRYDPWELPGVVNEGGEKQWFFFVPRDHKQSCSRPSRLTVSGYWKATGSDRPVRNELLHCIGLKKTLVFYKGKAPLGQRTHWIMNEYRLPDFRPLVHKMKDIVLCRIYRKAVSQKSIEQRAMPDHVQSKEQVVSEDEYKEEPHSTILQDSFQISNTKTKTIVSSIHYTENQGGVWSPDLSKADEEASLFECLEPIMFCEETMAMRNPKSYKPPQLELPKLSMDCWFRQTIATPYSLLPTPSLFHIPLS
eukprot:PITA_11611